MEKKIRCLGIGVDIEQISRFKKMNFNKNISFYNKIFTPREIEYCIKKSNPYQHFAVRFCAKEAFIKASGLKVSFKDIELVKESSIPKIKVKGNKNLNVKLSLSHAGDYAIAFLIINDKGTK